jgi:hypothetical protein
MLQFLGVDVEIVAAALEIAVRVAISQRLNAEKAPQRLDKAIANIPPPLLSPKRQRGLL